MMKCRVSLGLLILILSITLVTAGCGGSMDEKSNNEVTSLEGVAAEVSILEEKVDDKGEEHTKESADKYETLPMIPINGNLKKYRGQHDSLYRFLVTGNTQGSVWGTEVFTDDSNLGAAAVHAGFLEPDQEGILVVRILPGQHSYSGSQKNGVTSRNYGSWTGSYEIISMMLVQEDELIITEAKDKAELTETEQDTEDHIVDQTTMQETGSSLDQSNDKDFRFDKSSGRIMRYNASEKDVVIPSKIDGQPVLEIGLNSFKGNQINTVEIPNSVTTIGTAAFSYNNLTSVTIPDSITSIGNNAFSNNRLTSITIPAGVTSIGDSAFNNNSLISVTIPESVSSIGDSAFSKNNLTSVAIPAGVTSIENSAFSYNNLTSVTIPSSVTSIETAAFSYNNLTSVTIPAKVEFIETNAFSNNNLASVTIPASVTSIGVSAFSNNNLTSVTISENVSSIETGAFSRNKLTSITIPSNVKSIGSGAFRYNNLRNVTIPPGVTSIGTNAFSNNDLTSVTIPTSVTFIGFSAFRFNNLSTVTIPNHTEVHTGAFDSNVIITRY